MNRTTKLVLGVAVAIVAALGIGWLWGASGRFDAERARDHTQVRLDLARARGAVLDARVSLYNMNFGEASRHLEEAKLPLHRAHTRLDEMRRQEAAESLQTAAAHVEEAQRLSGQLDPTAQNAAAEAIRAIDMASSAYR